MIFNRENTPSWIIFMIDVGVCTASLALAYIVRFNFDPVAIKKELLVFPLAFPVVVAIRAVSFYLGKTYAGIIRYTSTKDAQRIFSVIGYGTLFLVALNLVQFYLIDGRFVVPFSVVIIDFLAALFFMLTLRVIIKLVYFEVTNPSRNKDNILVFGAGESGVITKRTLDRDGSAQYNVVGFVDDSSRKQGKKIEGTPIYPAAQLESLIERLGVKHLIISPMHLSKQRKSELIDVCLDNNVDVLNVPPVMNWINGELSVAQIKAVKIEELLGRAPIQLDVAKIGESLAGKVILVTGAAGSIGSEISRQVASYRPSQLLLLDQGESPLYELDIEMEETFGPNCCEVVIGNIRNANRMRNVFETFKPDVVFHAAAYKHVPLMEDNPSEAIRTNVQGTRHLVDLACEFGVERFVMISTDKAVNPTNVMGASKRVAEIYAQSANQRSKTRFITTRFGNVLGSNGSVIPVFKKQIEKGGPVKVTHPEITRFFMTIPEATQLVLEASTMGKGGEIFIFDMGQSVRIVDLAKKMIKLSGLELGKDIQIQFTGLRPGEKLYEELLADKENTIPTHHPQIMVAKVREYDQQDVTEQIEGLTALYDDQNNEALVRALKAMVPEYISKNSEYSKLDQGS
ncbi:MAG: polysaccharide biosynthesis protein [Salibacteraceae bacterium]